MAHQTKNNIDSLQARRVVSYLFGLWRISPLMSWGMIVSQVVFAVVTSAIAPLFVSRLLTHIANGSATVHNSTGLLIGYVLTLILGDIIAIRITIALAFMAETRMQQRVGQRVMRSQTDKSLDFHANHMSGGIVSDATKLNGSIERFWDTLVFTAVPIMATVVSVCIALSFVLWQYAIVLFVLSLVIAGFIVRAQNAIAPVSREVSVKSSAVTAYLADVVANMSTVKAFAGEDHERDAYDAKLSVWRRTNLREMKYVLLVTGSFGSLMTVMNAVAFLAAVLATEHHIASIGATYLVIGYTMNVVNQLWQISHTTRNYIRIIGDASPMITMLDEPTELNDPKNPEKVRISRGKVEFKNVVFAHNNSTEAIFQKLNISVKPGEKIGLVGHSGSGKTTLTRLLLRFSDIDKGEIRIDGQNIAKITQADLRQHIAYVPQEPLLFHRSVGENIAYGQEGVDQESIEAAAKMASAHEFIVRLPQGYDTLVGERGVKLSGGQRQRVAIARALLKNAPILVLDEATSALDSESEVLIQEALWKLMEGRTAIVIAHRLSTIQHMDRIVVMDNGRVIEQGSHKELVRLKGAYAKLWAHQSGGFIED
jgi:ATP-binding cassette subfamily B protein